MLWVKRNGFLHHIFFVRGRSTLDFANSGMALSTSLPSDCLQIIAGYLDDPDIIIAFGASKDARAALRRGVAALFHLLCSSQQEQTTRKLLLLLLWFGMVCTAGAFGYCCLLGPEEHHVGSVVKN